MTSYICAYILYIYTYTYVHIEYIHIVLLLHIVSTTTVAMIHRARCEARVGDEIGTLSLVIRRLPSELGHRAAPAKGGTNEILAAATRLGNPVGSSDGPAESCQDNDREDEPDPADGPEEVTGDRGAAKFAPHLLGSVVDCRVNVVEHVVVVVIIVVQYILEDPSPNARGGCVCGAPTQRRAYNKVDNGQQKPDAGSSFVVAGRNNIPAPVEFHSGQDLSHQDLRTKHSVAKGRMAASLGTAVANIGAPRAEGGVGWSVVVIFVVASMIAIPVAISVLIW